MTRILRCLVYADPMSLVEFSNPESSSIIREISRVFGPQMRIDLVNAADVRNGHAFQQHADLFVLPGILGQSSLYPDHIGLEGNQHISNFIARGGTFLGVCAGAYYAASDIVYAPAWGPQKERHCGTLAIFNGLAHGPVQGYGRTTNDTPKTDMEEIGHVDPLHITIETGPMAGISLDVAYGLGPAFAAASGQPHTVLARYGAYANHAPAIIEVPHGQGRALLCGVLPQFGYEENPAPYKRTLEPHTAHLLETLYANRDKRRALWNYLMNRVAAHHGTAALKAS